VRDSDLALESVKIRSATPADLDSLLELERATPSAAHWSKRQYEDLFREAEGAGRFIIVIEEEAQGSASEGPSRNAGLSGFLVARRVVDEWELENIVVVPHAQRKGLGKRLLGALLAHAGETNSRAMFLEVRESNAAARSLYEATGWRPTGRRKSYYANPEEDAILYSRQVKPAPFSQ